MKKLFVAVLVALAVASSSNAMAQTPVKVGVIDLKKTFDGYWKTKQADVNLKLEVAELEKQGKVMADSYERLNADYKKALDGSTDLSVSAEEQAKRKKLAESMLMEMRETEQSIQQFTRASRTKLAEKSRQMRENILKEIKEAVSAKSKAAGYDVVLDSAAETSNLTPLVIFWNGTGDITDAVLSHLNANAPAETPAAPAAAPADKGKSK